MITEKVLLLEIKKMVKENILKDTV